MYICIYAIASIMPISESLARELCQSLVRWLRFDGVEKLTTAQWLINWPGNSRMPGQDMQMTMHISHNSDDRELDVVALSAVIHIKQNEHQLKCRISQKYTTRSAAGGGRGLELVFRTARKFSI